MGITLVLKHREKDIDCICFENPERQFRQKVEKLLADCDKHNGYVSVTFDKPYKHRTTGEGSQNNLIWKLITIIAENSGSTLKEVEDGLKDRAISKGYPYHINVVTQKPKGNSMTTINTVEASYLIDTAYEVIAEQGIILPPQYTKHNEQPVIEKPSVNTSAIAEQALEEKEEFDIF